MPLENKGGPGPPQEDACCIMALGLKNADDARTWLKEVAVQALERYGEKVNHQTNGFPR